MATNTTLNINLAIMDSINFASEFTGETRSKIIIRLLMKVLANENHRACRSGAVKYQEKDKKGMWHPFHITFNAQEYEYFQDLKRFLKVSLSLALAQAVKKYLDKMIYGEETDNYKFNDYKFSREVIKSEIKFTISWGKPVFAGKLINEDTS